MGFVQNIDKVDIGK